MFTRREILAAPLAGIVPDADVAKLVRELKEELDALKEELHRLAQDNPPVGGVMAFAGAWPPPVPPKEGGVKRTSMEAEDFLGWMHCDGRTLQKKDYPVLAEVIRDVYKPNPTEPPLKEGAFRLPNYLGYFLRGVASGSATDPDRESRVGGDKAGSTQDWATRAPHKMLEVSSNGAFEIKDHFVVTVHADKDDGKIARWPRFVNSVGTVPLADVKAEPLKIANHSHTVSGGDAETRPVNVAVYWIIKIR